MIFIGILLLVGAGAIGLIVISTSHGTSEALDDLPVFGAALDDSAVHIFFYGIVTGVALLLGLYLTLEGAWHRLLRRIGTYRELRQSRRERRTLENQRDELAGKVRDKA